MRRVWLVAAASAGLTGLSVTCVVLALVVLSTSATPPATTAATTTPPRVPLRLAPPLQPTDTNISVINGVPITARMQNLRPALGVCYERSPALHDAVLLWRERASDAALDILAGLEGIEPRRLAINIAQMHDMYDVIDTNADAILTAAPGDPHALFVKALYAHASGQLDDYTAFATRLSAASPTSAIALDRAVNDVVLAWDTTYPPPQLPSPRWQPNQLAIVVFGCPVLPDGTPSPGLQDRLDAALQLHAQYPDAIIIASGGAVRARCTPTTHDHLPL